MTLSRVWTVVSTNWLKGQIGNHLKKQAPRNLRVLDTSFVNDRNADVYNESYKLGHIPQAVHFDLFKCTETTPEVLLSIPDVNCFTDYAQSLGIWSDTHVIAYDRFGPQSAYKTWWLFRLFGHKNISVLDGGLRKWLDDGFEVATDVPEIERSDFVASLNKNLLSSFEDVIHNVDTNQEQIVDARKIDDKSCISEEKCGRIKGAKHVPFSQLFKEDGTMKTDKELKTLFDASGVDLGLPVMVTCLTGMTSCAVAGAAHILGKENVPVYYGSWREFGARASPEYKVLPEKTS